MRRKNEFENMNVYNKKSNTIFSQHIYASVLTFHSNPHNDKLNKQVKMFYSLSSPFMSNTATV